MDRDRLAQARIRGVQVGWSTDRIAHGFRTAVYAVATADRLGRSDLVEIRVQAETERDADPIVRLARWFDAATYPPRDSASVREALARLDDLGFDPALVEAFRAVQPLIQPVGLE